jgi:ABC-type multidrug transport system fused ATPase/permease subunit
MSIRTLRDHLTAILRAPTPAGRRLGGREIRFFLEFARPLWRLGLATIILTALTCALGALLPLSSKIIIDLVIGGEGADAVTRFLSPLGLGSLAEPLAVLLSDVNRVILIILGVGLIMGVLGIVQNILTLHFQQEVTFRIQTALFDHLLRVPLSLIREKQVGYLMSRVSGDVAMLQYFFSTALPQMITYGFYFLFSFGIILTLSRPITLLLAVLIPAWIGINAFFGGRLRAVSHQEMEGQARVSRDMQEMLAGAEVIKSNVTEGAAVRRVAGRLRGLFRTRIRSAVLRAVASHAMRATKLITALIVVWLSVGEIRADRMTVGDMTALLSYVIFLAGLANSFSSMFLMMQTVAAAAERLTELFGAAPEYDADEAVGGIIPEAPLRGELCFDNVAFSYEPGSPVLTDVSVTVHPGEMVALVGPSGAGKTTLINLLLKFHRPTDGQIRIDGIDLDGLDTRWLRRRVGFVSQDIFLFQDTVANNIRHARPDAGPEAIEEAARAAGIHDEIRRFPDGYETRVGERGMRLSAGQRQRISIARAFLKNPAILILDEPTSALDAGTEAVVQSALADLTRGRTTLMITHRASVAEGASRVLELENGRIRERSRRPS